MEQVESECYSYERDLIGLGVKKEDIILESKSRNTKENAIYTKNMMRDKNYKKALLITSAIHMTRSMEVFKDEEIKFYPYPCGYLGHTKIRGIQGFIPQYMVLKNIFSTLWEYFGMIYYKVRY